MNPNDIRDRYKVRLPKNPGITRMVRLLKSLMKRVPGLIFAKDVIWATFSRYYNRHNLRITQGMKMFAPGSAGSPKAIADLTFLSVNQTFPILARLIIDFKKRGLLEPIRVESFCSGVESMQASEKLNDLFRFYGSDKSSGHNYQYLYGEILKNADSITRLLEIGLGTNNVDVVSNMGLNGKPGASLRAFRDFLPKASIFGADIDSRILFQEDRIRTFFVDQTDLETFRHLGENVGNGFDLIIDDGLHSPNANIGVLIFATQNLKNGGWLVIEDITHEALPIWQVVAELLPADYKPYLLETNKALVFAVQKR